MFARLVVLAAVVCCAGLAVMYATRADAFAAVTVCPLWAWCLPGVGAILLVWRRAGRLAWLGLAAWAIYLLALADTPAALVRAPLRRLFGTPAVEANNAEPVRVVSLNCGSFGGRSASDVLDLKPQIVLLQESPGIDEVENLARALYGPDGGFFWSGDASIVAHGVVTPLGRESERGSRAVFAHVKLANGQEVHVVSLRLRPAVVRLDFWSPDCWRSQTANRQDRRRELKAIADRVAELPANIPLVLGGDFNAPAGDAVFRELQPRLRDAFREAGVGWGNTIINEAPFARIDQIWIDDHWRAVTVRAARTLQSDHRLVIGDLLLKAPPN